MAINTGRSIGLLTGAALTLVAGTAQASNGTKPRIPVDWTGAPCMTIVDRGSGTVEHLPYAIPMEDTDVTADEVEDSRTHQFFALCRAHDPQEYLPRWITQADIDRALMIGAAPDDIDPEDVLETATAWADCYVRITPDDARIPITFAAAMQGVDWDTSTAPAGTYTVEAYTWEPPINIWSARPGVIKVVDSPALEASGPALAVSNVEEVINKNESVTIEGCVSAMDGSTVTAYWALAEPNLTWQPFIEDDPIAGDSFAVEFTPPEEAAGNSLIMRVDVTDPMGRSYTNYMRDLVIVLGTDGPGSCDGGVGFIGGAGCEDDTGDSGSGGSSGGSGSDEGTTAASDSAEETLGQDGQTDGGGGGCSCTTAPGSAPWGAALLGVVLLGWRRRRVA